VNPCRAGDPQTERQLSRGARARRRAHRQAVVGDGGPMRRKTIPGKSDFLTDLAIAPAGRAARAGRHYKKASRMLRSGTPTPSQVPFSSAAAEIFAPGYELRR
jgi:hypothetical protein